MILLKRLLGRAEPPSRGRHSAGPAGVDPMPAIHTPTVFVPHTPGWSQPGAVTVVAPPHPSPVIESAPPLHDVTDPPAVELSLVPDLAATTEFLSGPVRRVTLGFEDGTELALAADDPRSRAFQAIAGVLTGPKSLASDSSRTA